MLTDAQILSRRLRFGCCALDYLDKYIEAKIHGDHQCAEKNWALYLQMEFAKSVMDDTPVGDEDGCTTLDFASTVAAKMDCLCTCGCPEPSDEPNCTITPFAVVIAAIPFDELPPEPEDGDSYYILEGDNTGRIATWSSEGPEWVFTVVGVNNIIEDAAGDYWWNLGDGPGPLFPTATLTMVGNDVWSMVSDSPDTNANRTIQLLGYGFTAPQQGYVMWEGNESDLPLNVNLFGLPFGTLRLRYILPNGCEYLSDVLTTIPEIDPETEEPVCGTIGTPIVGLNRNPTTGITQVTITIPSVSGYPLGPVTYTLNDDPEPIIGPQLVVGVNNVAVLSPGDTAVFTITNVFDPECNIVLDPVEAECGTIDVVTEVVQVCEDGDPPVPLWGVLVTITNNDGYVVNQVTYTTPEGTYDADLFAPGVWACGPLVNAEDPGPMTINIPNANSKFCEVEVGPFEAPGCGGECPEADADYELVFIEGVLNLQVNINSSDPFPVGEIQWSINGTPQTPVEVNGIVGGYVLGPVEEGDEIQITYTNSEDPECNDVRPLFTVPSPCESDTSLHFDFPEGASGSFFGATTGGYFSVFEGGALLGTTESGQGVGIGGSICIVPTDIDGNPTGQWTGVGFVFTSPGNNEVIIDLSNLAGVALSEEVDTLTGQDPASLAFIDSEERLSIEIPPLSGPNESLSIDNFVLLENVVIPVGVKFKRITVIGGAALTTTSIDALCNALDATATGRVSSISVAEGPAPTAASAANRAAYIANGNTLTVFEP